MRRGYYSILRTAKLKNWVICSYPTHICWICQLENIEESRPRGGGGYYSKLRSTKVNILVICSCPTHVCWIGQLKIIVIRLTQIFSTRVCFTKAGVNSNSVRIHKVRKHPI